MSGWQFPQWNYGYTQMPGYYLAPPHAGVAPGMVGTRPAFTAPLPNAPHGSAPRPPVRPPLPPGPRKTPPPSATATTAATSAATTTVKTEAPTTAVKEEPKKEENKPATAKEAPAVKTAASILKGRNAVMYCNDQSKSRGLHMEWEQVSEVGPPHDKTYEYQLKMGDLATNGMGKNKKDAKTKAAENMVLKLEDLPKVIKRGWGQAWGGGSSWGGHSGGGRGGYHHHGGPAWKRRKGESEDTILKKNDVTPKAENPSQNNPISKLFEFSKKRKWPEPIFDCISEEVLEERRTDKGFTLRKTNFTLRCTVRPPPGQGEEKIYIGNALTKKQAKTNAAHAAWAELSSGMSVVDPESVDKLLSAARNADKASGSKEKPKVEEKPAIPAQPKITVHKGGNNRLFGNTESTFRKY